MLSELISKFTPRLKKKDKGASYIEAAIAIPIALLGMFGFTYFSLALIAMGILDHTANRTMRAITTHPAFDKQSAVACEASYVCTGEDTEDVCKALYCFKDNAKNIPLSTFFGLGEASGKIAYIDDSNDNPKITMPEVPANQSYEDAIKKQPVIVTLTAKLRNPWVWSSDITLTSTATGFIEIKTKPNLPAIMDCNGYRKGDPRYKTEPCSCDAQMNQVWNPYANEGEGMCETCKYDRRAPGSEPDGSDPAGYYAPEDYGSVWMVKSDCLCPTSKTCRDKYGVGAYSAYVFSNRTDNNVCRCACAGMYGWDAQAGQANPYHAEFRWLDDPAADRCENCEPIPSPVKSKPDGTLYVEYPDESERIMMASSQSLSTGTTIDLEDINFVELKHTRVVKSNGWNGEFEEMHCKCEKLDGSMMTWMDCKQIFANTPLENLVIARYDGCGCQCSQCPSEDFGQDQGFISYNLTHPDACKCNCPAYKPFDMETNKCVCLNAADETNGNCPSPAKLNKECVCECPNKDCGEGITKTVAGGCLCSGCQFGVVNNPASSRNGLCKLNESDMGG